jgi:hypothetical protein
MSENRELLSRLWTETLTWTRRVEKPLRQRQWNVVMSTIGVCKSVCQEMVKEFDMLKQAW